MPTNGHFYRVRFAMVCLLAQPGLLKVLARIDLTVEMELKCYFKL